MAFPPNLLTDTSENQDYAKGPVVEKSKEISSKPLEMISGGGKTGDGGPTSSSREYPKGSKVSMTPDFNPMAKPATDFAIGGVGKGED